MGEVVGFQVEDERSVVAVTAAGEQHTGSILAPQPAVAADVATAVATAAAWPSWNVPDP